MTITFHFLSFRSLTIFEINIERFGKKLFSKISTNNRIIEFKSRFKILIISRKEEEQI